ncbi:endonuclease/exonuclease/phosphatase family protein [Novosphingobium sp. 1949]|uniref:Endonuclease/exonuclease/phosphatase family protein n=1 Tax=Novosphingobium organovorum TaxID=2930092 RepID=A0ABT0BFU8_9SPHN|nr:endonuclease/exonuclease/phosphatase family protein [Novosphingobium organovorum]
MIAPGLSELWPWFDLAALVQRPAAFAGLAGAAGLVWALRSWALRGLALFAAIALCFAIPLRGTLPERCPAGAGTLRIAWINAQGARHPEQIVDWIAAEKPQIVGFAEVRRVPPPLAAYLLVHLPYTQNCLGNGHCSTALYARERPVGARALARGDPENRKTLSGAALEYARMGGGGQGRIAAVHLSRPTSAAQQARELQQLESRMPIDADTVVVGDFNLSVRMTLLTRFAERHRLSLVLADRPTWPTVWRGRRVGGLWQIDQLLLGRNWRAKSMRASPFLGSDHRGFVADLCHISAM